jgi:hypothetical protein
MPYNMNRSYLTIPGNTNAPANGEPETKKQTPPSNYTENDNNHAVHTKDEGAYLEEEIEKGGHS